MCVGFYPVEYLGLLSVYKAHCCTCLLMESIVSVLSDKATTPRIKLVFVTLVSDWFGTTPRASWLMIDWHMWNYLIIMKNLQLWGRNLGVYAWIRAYFLIKTSIHIFVCVCLLNIHYIPSIPTWHKSNRIEYFQDAFDFVFVIFVICFCLFFGRLALNDHHLLLIWYLGKLFL